MDTHPQLAGLIAPLFEHSYPWLAVDPLPWLSDSLDELVETLERAPETYYVSINLARSWSAVAKGSENFNAATLAVLRSTETILRSHAPHDGRALALNLAAQGCHSWHIESAEAAISPLTEAFNMMISQTLATAADVLKVSEVLSDSLRRVDRFDEALIVLARGYPYLRVARDQDEWIPRQYNEWRGEFVDEYGGLCSPDLRTLLTLLEPSWTPDSSFDSELDGEFSAEIWMK